MTQAKLYPIKNLVDAMFMRTIRNECRQYMTHDISKISVERQRDWYLKTYKEMNKSGEIDCYLLKTIPDQEIVGFGVIRLKDHRRWLTGGLKARYRNQGYGLTLFHQLIAGTPSKQVWLDVLDTNEVAKHIYEKLGFKLIEEKVNEWGQKILIMKLIRL